MVFLSKLLKWIKDEPANIKQVPSNPNMPKPNFLEEEKNRKALRKGELGEYKIDIQLGQLPKGCKFLSDQLLRNPKAHSGFSQIDHVVITPYGLFVIETKNYAGEISGRRKDKIWFQNGKYEIFNPIRQNYGHISSLRELLSNFKDLEFISIVSFTRRSIFKVDPELRKITSSELIIYDTELSEFIHRKVTILSRGQAKPPLHEQDIQQIYKIISDKNIKDAAIRKEHVKKNNSRKSSYQQSFQSSSSQQCVICGITVSDKVRDYCMSNNKRFGGKVVCYDHQVNF